MIRASVLSCVAVLVGLASLSVPASAKGLTPGPVELKSIGPMTFADGGVLLVGDPKAATVYAIEIEADEDGSGQAQWDSLQIKDLSAAIASEIGSSADKVSIGDLAVDPESKSVVVSAASGDVVHLLHIHSNGDVHAINLDKVPHAAKQLPNPPADEMTGEGRRRKNLRMESITDLAFFEGKLMVSGVSATESPSSVMEFDYPFADNSIVTNVQIYHAAHGRVEEPAIRAFVPMNIDGQPTLLAGFTCTPLVRFPINQLGSDDTVRGTTIAELGNRNSPIDLISYQKDGESVLLMSNTVRGVMKISTEDIQNAEGLTERVGGGGTAGQPFETIDALSGVTHMSKLSNSHAVVIVDKSAGSLQLKVVELP